MILLLFACDVAGWRPPDCVATLKQQPGLRDWAITLRQAAVAEATGWVYTTQPAFTLGKNE